MIQIPPAIRLSLGLVLLTVSILILAQALGLTPNNDKQQLQLRQQLAETLAIQTTVAMQRNDATMLNAIFNNTVARNKEILSTALRQSTHGEPLSQTEGHARFWRGAANTSSTPTHVRLPIYIDNIQRGLLEISFAPLQENSDNFLGLPNFMALTLFIALSGFIGYWFFIKRALKHLDPSAVVPARVKNALNILSEGVLILDKRQHIVLVNDTLSEKLHSSEKQLLGRKASDMNWQVDPSEEERDLPWEIALNTGQTRRGINLKLEVKEVELTFRVNAVPIQDDGGNRQGTIVSFDDVSELEEKNTLLEGLLQQVSSVQAALEKKNRELGYLASRDPLTGCFNRRALYEYLDKKFATAMDSKAEFTCIMTDIDHFKNVNDTYGHSVGDEIIKMVANSIQDSLRDGDIVARYGGEEFCVILPRTPLSEACIVAERCRETIEAQICEGVKVTSSFGVSSLEFKPEDPQALITQADEALYLSKESGRNCVNPWNPTLANKH